MTPHRSSEAEPLLSVRSVAKSFTVHLRGGIRLPVIENVTFDVGSGECVVLGGPSGVGKSSILRMVFGNYAIDRGEILVREQGNGAMCDLGKGDPRVVIRLRERSIAYVSQFLRVIPRASALEVVAEPLVRVGFSREIAAERAAAMLRRLNLPEALHALPPATFSGGEKQRVNIARGFLTDHPILLLDEPTASLDAANRDVVVAMIREKLAQGVAILGIFHDEPVRDAVASRILDVASFSVRRAA